MYHYSLNVVTSACFLEQGLAALCLVCVYGQIWIQALQWVSYLCISNQEGQAVSTLGVAHKGDGKSQYNTPLSALSQSTDCLAYFF